MKYYEHVRKQHMRFVILAWFSSNEVDIVENSNKWSRKEQGQS